MRVGIPGDTGSKQVTPYCYLLAQAADKVLVRTLIWQDTGHGIAVPSDDDPVRVELFQKGQTLLFELGSINGFISVTLSAGTLYE